MPEGQWEESPWRCPQCGLHLQADMETLFLTCGKTLGKLLNIFVSPSVKWAWSLRRVFIKIKGNTSVLN